MICFPLDNTPYEAKDMGAYLCTRTRGVYSADGNLAVSPASTGLAVTVSPGLAWLRWSDYWGVAALLEATQTLTLDAADGSLSRMDAVVCRLNKVDNQAEIIIKKGSWSSSPTVVAPVRDSNYDEIYLATVLVGPGAVSVSASDITDQRLNEDYCGIMRDGVTGIPTEQLQAQTQAIIDDLREVIAGIEQGSEVMLKDVYVDGDDPQPVAKANSAPWSGITGRPGTYPPSAHTHDDRYYTESEINSKLNGKANTSGTYQYLSVGNATNANYANSAGSARASNISMSLSGTTLNISYS